MNVAKQDTSQQETTYNKIVGLLDINDTILDALENPDLRDQHTMTNICAPVLENLAQTVDVLTALFVEHVRANEKPDRVRSRNVDSTIKQVYEALYEMKLRGEALAIEFNKEK